MKIKSHLNSKANDHLTPSLSARRIMPWIVLFLGMCLLPRLAQAQVSVTLPWYEPFAYGEGDQLGAAATSGTNWNTGNSASSSSARSQAAAALNYAGLFADTNSTPRGLRSGSGTGKNRGVTFAAVSNVTVYASFLLNVQTNPTVPRTIFCLSSTTGTGPNGNATVWLDNSGRLLLGKVNSSTLTYNTNIATPLAPTNTYLVVLAYKFIAGATTNDEVDLWVDPIPLGNASSIPTPTLVTTNGSDAPSLQSVYVLAPSSQVTALFYLDELRVGTTWASVMPTAPAPGTTYNVTGGGFVCAGAGVSIGLSGSDTGVDYWLMTNGAPAGVVVPGAGAAISFGLETNVGYYTVFGSNTVTLNTGWMTNSATVANGCPPVINVQPASLTVPSGCSCTYSVSASGASLVYQWRHNGTNLIESSHYSGTATANLTIYPVGSGDVAGTTDGYDVVISGQFGSPATSTRVGLSLGAAHNLTWVGDGVSNLWDVLTSANWALPGGVASVFNYGDNVTLDDTTGNTTVNLGSQFLSPATMTVNAGTYAFTGNGNISGAGTVLVASNTASLTMNIVNRYGGGTVIQSNATVNLQYATSLGSGPVMLDGGTLHITAGSKSLTFTNNIQVLTDSMISGVAGSTPSMSCVFTGTAGSLTFNGDSASSFFSPNLYVNFTFNLPVNINNTVMVLMADNTGQQVFNGPFSGNGSIQRRATGTAIFNAPSIYSGNTLLSSGGLGFGCSTISTNTPLPTIDAGPIGLGTLMLDDTGTAANQWVFAAAGARLVGNPLQTSTGTNNFTLVFAGTNNLELAGAINMGTGVLTVQATNAAVSTLSGGISQGSGLTKTGGGVVVLRGDDAYTGPTLVSAGRLEVDGQIDDSSDPVTVTGATLCGSGTIQGPVIIQTGATLSPGSAGLGVLTINNNLTLNGNLLFAVDKTQTQSNGLVNVSGVLTNIGTGTVIVTNVGPALAVGDSFTIFSQSVSNGAALAVTGGGMNWTNKLAVDGSIQALSVISTIANYSTNISFTVNGSTLTVKWPATHLGWILESQTNALNSGLTAPSNTWHAISGSAAVTQTNMGINPANPTVFFRLRHP